MAGPSYALQQPRSLEEAEGLLMELCKEGKRLGRGQEAVVCGLRLMASGRDTVDAMLDRTLEALHRGGAGVEGDPQSARLFKVPVLVVRGIKTDQQESPFECAIMLVMPAPLLEEAEEQLQAKRQRTEPAVFVEERAKTAALQLAVEWLLPLAVDHGRILMRRGADNTVAKDHMFGNVVIVGTPEQQARWSMELLQRGTGRTFAAVAEEMCGVMTARFGRLLRLQAGGLQEELPLHTVVGPDWQQVLGPCVPDAQLTPLLEDWLSAGVALGLILTDGTNRDGASGAAAIIHQLQLGDLQFGMLLPRLLRTLDRASIKVAVTPWRSTANRPDGLQFSAIVAMRGVGRLLAGLEKIFPTGGGGKSHQFAEEHAELFLAALASPAAQAVCLVIIIAGDGALSGHRPQAGCTQHHAVLYLISSRNLAMAELVVRMASPILAAAGYDPPTIRRSRRAGDYEMFYVALHGRLIVGRFLHELYKRITSDPLALQRLAPVLSRLRTFATPPEAPAFWPLLALWPARKQGALLRLLDRGAISVPGGIKCFAVQVEQPFIRDSFELHLFEVEVPEGVWQEKGVAAGQQPDLYITEAGARQLLCCSNSNQNVAAALLPAERVAEADGAASKAFLLSLIERLSANGIVPPSSARSNLMRAGPVLQLLLSGPLMGQVSCLVQLQKQHSGAALLSAQGRAAYQQQACLTARSAAAALGAITPHMLHMGAARHLQWSMPGFAQQFMGQLSAAIPDSEQGGVAAWQGLTKWDVFAGSLQARGGHRNHLARLAQGCQLLLLHQRVPAPEKGKFNISVEFIMQRHPASATDRWEVLHVAATCSGLSKQRPELPDGAPLVNIEGLRCLRAERGLACSPQELAEAGAPELGLADRLFGAAVDQAALAAALEAGGLVEAAPGRAVPVYSLTERTLALLAEGEARCSRSGGAYIVEPFTGIAVARVTVPPGCMATVSANTCTQWFRRVTVDEVLLPSAFMPAGWASKRVYVPVGKPLLMWRQPGVLLAAVTERAAGQGEEAERAQRQLLVAAAGPLHEPPMDEEEEQQAAADAEANGATLAAGTAI